MDRPSTDRPVIRRALPLVGAVLAGVIALGGCSANSSGGAASAGSAAGVAPAAAPGAQKRGGAEFGQVAPDAGSPGVLSGAVAAVGAPRLIRTAELTVEVRDLAVAAARVRATATGLGGSVSSETTGFGEPAALKDTGSGGTGPDVAPTPQAAERGESVLVLRVPEARLDSAIQEVGAVGTQLSRTSSSQDVTGDLADLSSRVSTQRASVARVRALLARARTLQEIVLLESETSKRESDLEALEARLAALGDQADLATLTVVLRTPEAAAAPATDELGFLTGLRNGWKAVLLSTSMVLTVLGALLPVVLVLGLVGIPALVLVRRRRDRGGAPTAS